jgi:hypothetical protein
LLVDAKPKLITSTLSALTVAFIKHKEMDRLKYTSFGCRFFAGIVDGLVFIPLGIIQI